MLRSEYAFPVSISIVFAFAFAFVVAFGELKSKGVITSKGHWKCFQTAPKDMKGLEDDIFQGIADIGDAVVSAASALLDSKSPTTKLECRPRNTEKSETENASYKHDANQFLVDSESTGVGTLAEGSRFACDSVVTYEFKKSDDVKEINQVSKTTFDLNTRVVLLTEC